MSGPGFVEWFRPGEHARAEAVIAGLSAVGCRHLRTHLSWAEFHVPGGPEWFDWLLPRLGEAFEMLPCVHYTPPSLSRTGRSSGAPRDLQAYADFIDLALDRWGTAFRHVELWNEPNNLLDWDWRADPDYALFSEMLGMAAHWVRERGWVPVLGGPAPVDPVWLELMGERGLLSLMGAVGVHGFPGTWDSEAAGWSGWDLHLAEMRAVLDRWNPGAEIWITETGYSTWRDDQIEQLRRYVEARETPADRVYWYGWQDLSPRIAVQEGPRFDPRHYHMGACDAAGRPKLLARMLQARDTQAMHRLLALAAPHLARAPTARLVTGGAGFIGANLADRMLREGHEVILYDNLSRPGVEENLDWLAARHGARLHPMVADLRDEAALAEAARGAEACVHLAAQTAVTTSLATPLEDFEVNARGTLNLLEALRATGRAVPLVFASTNKVYGALSDIVMAEGESQHRPADAGLASRGIGEDQALDFCTPYGCSKGVADQYVRDYAKSFGLPTAVLRMSCIYGPRQFGTEDQGWVAHFLIRALERREITLFGDGRQTRDILHVHDAVEAYARVLRDIGRLSGQAFNLGGGGANAVSLAQVLGRIEALTGEAPRLRREGWRTGDQPWFVSDTARLHAATGWRPRIGWQKGLSDLADWLAEARGLSGALAPAERLRA